MENVGTGNGSYDMGKGGSVLSVKLSIMDMCYTFIMLCGASQARDRKRESVNTNNNAPLFPSFYIYLVA